MISLLLLGCSLGWAGAIITYGNASNAEQRLLTDLFAGYQSLTRPIREYPGQPVKVFMGMQLVLLVQIDEREQIVHTNVWLSLKWHDDFLDWDPRRYGGIESLRIPQDKVWMPDIVLYNNADGGYEPTYKANVVLRSDGEVQWIPPALLKSTCIMNVEHFPFDEQECTMYFKSWTYNEDELREGIDGIDLSQYVYNYIWDIFDAPATRGNAIDPVSHPHGVSFTIRLKRKTLFYTVILIIPCVMMGLCTTMVFYLPTKAGEKIGLSIYILLSITVFLNLLGTMVPLMAKYVLLNFILNILTIFLSVIIVNVYFRSPHTTTLPYWIKLVFIKTLAKLMLMRRPPVRPVVVSLSSVSPPPFDRKVSTYAALKEAMTKMKSQQLKQMMQATVQLGGGAIEQKAKEARDSISEGSTPEGEQQSVRTKRSRFVQIPEVGLKVVKTLEYITEHLKRQEDVKKVREEWHYVSMVIDRLLLYVFAGITLGGSMGMFLSVENVIGHVDQKHTLMRLSQQYGWDLARNYMNSD